MTAPQKPPPRLGLPAEVRPWVSLAIFIHLFLVFVALSSNVASGLQGKLLASFSYYLYPLNLTVDYSTNYQLTHGLSLDADHAIEVDVPSAQGEPEVFRIPRDGWRGGESFRRQQKLANVAADWLTAQDDEFKQHIPQALSARYMQQAKADSARVRIKSHLLLDARTAASADKAQSDPNAAGLYRTLYDATARSLGGQILLKESTDALEAAPAANSPQTQAPAK